MTTEDFKRKLTTILHADVKGYSRLMDEDEEATVSTLTAYREVMGKFIQKHRGRVVHGSGDSLLAEFVSVVDAVRCAVEIQKELSAPIAKGDIVGKIFYNLNDEEIAQVDLIALEDVELGSWFSRLIDYFKLLFAGWFG